MTARKNLYDRYTYDQLKAFEKKYNWEKGFTQSQGQAVAAAGMDTLYSNKEWNGSNGSALFEDALIAAARIDIGLWHIEG